MKLDNTAFYCKDCGQMFFATVNDPACLSFEVTKDIGKYLRQGHDMRIVDTETVRRDFNGCTCHQKKQLSLFK